VTLNAQLSQPFAANWNSTQHGWIEYQTFATPLLFRSCCASHKRSNSWLQLDYCRQIYSIQLDYNQVIATWVIIIWPRISKIQMHPRKCTPSNEIFYRQLCRQGTLCRKSQWLMCLYCQMTNLKASDENSTCLNLLKKTGSGVTNSLLCWET
jgi:hypothetical protein